MLHCEYRQLLLLLGRVVVIETRNCVFDLGWDEPVLMIYMIVDLVVLA
jgi:hypothetical protein